MSEQIVIRSIRASDVVLLKRAHPKGVSLKQLKDAAHVYCEGSGGVEAFGRAYRAMIQNEEMRKIGQNVKGKDLFGLVCD